MRWANPQAVPDLLSSAEGATNDKGGNSFVQIQIHLELKPPFFFWGSYEWIQPKVNEFGRRFWPAEPGHVHLALDRAQKVLMFSANHSPRFLWSLTHGFLQFTSLLSPGGSHVVFFFVCVLAGNKALHLKAMRITCELVTFQGTQ